MTVIEHGVVNKGVLVIERPLGMPDGTRVRVTLEDDPAPRAMSLPVDVTTLPFFGLWSDRTDLEDSVVWVDASRDRWRDRAGRAE